MGRHILTKSIFIVGLITPASADICRVSAHDVFVPQGKKRQLLALGANTNVVFFRTGLRVNTDGARNSYHPMDPTGTTKAINNIANGIAISKGGQGLKYSETIRIFELWRDNSYRYPDGYKIAWRNVIGARQDGSDTNVPCTFSQGPFAGYFVSLTTLKNRLPADKAGECDANNQLDERIIPAVVLAGGSSPMRSWGVGVGDLVVVRNPETDTSVAAVIGDTGPPNNLGEGSVALNMKLLDRIEQPKTYAEAKGLDTGNKAVDVAIFPRTANYRWVSPVSAENLRERLDALLQERHLPPFGDAAKSYLQCSGLATP